MEILNSGAKKRTLLLVYDSEEMLDALRGILEQEYKLILVEHDDRDFSRVLEEAVDAISAAVISAADVLMPPLLPEVVLNRIRNAIRLKDSATFLEIERMLNKLPSLIYLKDAEGRYVFSTHYWHHLEHGDDPDWTIRGKTDVEIRKDKENAIKAMESDREIIRTGKGTDYVIEVNADGMREFLEIIKEPVYDKHGRINGIIALINNVTESQLMRLSLEEKAMKDEEQHFRIKDRTISISYGASCIRNENQTLHGCLDVADKRMYENKREHKRTSVR